MGSESLSVLILFPYSLECGAGYMNFSFVYETNVMWVWVFCLDSSK